MDGKDIKEYLEEDKYYKISDFTEDIKKNQLQVRNTPNMLLAITFRMNIMRYETTNNEVVLIKTYKYKYPEYEFTRTDCLTFPKDNIKIGIDKSSCFLLYTEDEYYKYEDNFNQ